MTDLMENGKCSSRVIDEVATTPDTLTSRGGLSFFVRYLRNIGLAPHLQRLFGSIRKSAKGQQVGEIFKQLFCFFLDGTSRHLEASAHRRAVAEKWSSPTLRLGVEHR